MLGKNAREGRKDSEDRGGMTGRGREGRKTQVTKSTERHGTLSVVVVLQCVLMREGPDFTMETS